MTECIYDVLEQLLTEKHDGVVVNAMVYDNYGNIVSKDGKVYAYDATWKDLLTSYDGQSITYDAQGNPTSYLGHTLTWEKGRQLKNFDNSICTYNANSIRTSKTVNGVKHTYTLDGSKILRETWGGNTIIPMYDNKDAVCGIIYNSEPYYFFKNLQGDVIAIADKQAKVVAKYSYDAWGVCTITEDNSGCSIATINPFRYRSYYFDDETSLYYLQSRYYNPMVGRFVNADDSEVLCLQNGTIVSNLMVYCSNNPTWDCDDARMFSFNDLFNKIKGFLQKLFNKFMDNLKKQIQITRKYIKISVGVIKLVLDIAVSVVVNKFLKWGIEKLVGFVMKKYIQNSTKSFIQFLGKVLNFGATKWLIKALMMRALNLGYIRSVSNYVKDIAVDTVLSYSMILSRINSICSACSSISGFIAFILDLADREWDDYLTIKLA